MIKKEALQEMFNGTRETRYFLAEHSFGLFCIYFFSDYFKYWLAPYHYDFIQDIEDLAEGKIREVLWIGYRECAKTTFAQLGNLWFLTFKKKRYINVDAYSSSNSERSLFDIAYHLISNKKYIADFWNLYDRGRGKDAMKQNKINNFTTENGCRIEASTTQIDVRWRKHLEYRPDFRWLDDFETHDTKDSEAITIDIRNNITSAMWGLAPNAGTLYTANYISEYWNVQWLLDRAKTDPSIRVRNIPIIIDGEPAWPEKYCMTDIEAKLTGKISIEDKKRQMGSQVFSYEFLNQPVDDSVAEFKKDWIKRIEEHEIQHLTFNTFITIDSAVSEKDSADSTGIVINRVSSEWKWYITAYKLKINPSKLIDHMFYLNDKYMPTMMWLEETTFTIAIRPFLEAEMAKRGEFFTVTPLKHWGTKKETRIRGLIPRYNNNGIFHVGDCSSLEDEMRVFPRGVNDDVLDALAYQEQIVFIPNSSREAPQPEQVRNFVTWELTYRNLSDIGKTYWITF